MWPAALTYVLSTDRQRQVFDRDRQTRHVVRKRHARRSRRSPGIDA